MSVVVKRFFALLGQRSNLSMLTDELTLKSESDQTSS